MFEEDEEFTEGIKTIEASGNSLCLLINDLLDLTLIQQGELTLGRSLTDLNQLVQSCVASFGSTFQDKKLELKLELNATLPPINVDPVRTERVIWNLLSNASKFTPDGGRVTVRTYIPETGDGGVALEVEDTGIGIAKDFLPLIWDRFRQLDASSTREHGGLGIGLAYVKEVVEAQGGTAEAAGNHALGMTFKIVLPAK